MAPMKQKKQKSPPIFSKEFIIVNHADIVSCVAMVVMAGLMFQITSPISQMFVVMQYNVTVNESKTPADQPEEVTYYAAGPKDVLSVFFYFMISIVIHAVLQEYFIDKLNRKLNLSKVKQAKFNESGQLVVFSLLSAGWGIDIIMKNHYLSRISSLWEGYPHVNLTFVSKFYFILQLAYWLHAYPELLLQKAKKEEAKGRIVYITLYMVLILSVYAFHLTRIGLCLLVIHYAVEFVFHTARILHFSEKTPYASMAFGLWNALFVLARLSSITLATLTFWFGLRQQPTLPLSADMGLGRFFVINNDVTRVAALAVVGLLQAWMMWNFITFHLKRRAANLSMKSSPHANGLHHGSGGTPGQSPGKRQLRKRRAKGSAAGSPN